MTSVLPTSTKLGITATMRILQGAFSFRNTCHITYPNSFIVTTTLFKIIYKNQKKIIRWIGT